ncbi:murein biosynthesis integral membrane protein MurJ [Candidatus Poribacteria bacterium]|nr:murein biosynthesis integral membrane protein MurJ [Candidatus Poribacteria bacterium]
MDKDNTQSRLTRSAGVVGIANMCSRVLGLVRVAVLAHFLEAKTALDAYYAAFTIPNLFRDLFGEGILSKAFVTTFAEVEARSGKEAAWRLTNLVFNAVVIILAVITILGIIASPFIVKVMVRGEGFDTVVSKEEEYGITDKRGLTVYLTRIMFPYLMLVSLAAICMGLLNSKDKFAVPASASAFFNVGSVVFGTTGFYLFPRLGLHPATGFAVGVLVGGVMQFGIQIPSVYRVGFRYKPVLSFTDPDLIRVMRLIAPAILGNAALQINVFFNRFFASQGEGWLAWNTLAFRMMHLPIGVMGSAISTATLPVLSRFVARDSMDEFKDAFSYSLRMMIILVLPASIGLMVLNKPVISLFQRGQFGPDDTVMAAGSLFFYAFGLCGYAGRQIATDGFIALKNMRVPVIISLFTISLNILLNYIFIFHAGIDHRSLAISTACSITINFFLLLILLRRRVGSFGGRRILSTFIRSLIAAGIMGFVVFVIFRYTSLLIGSKLALLLSFLVALPVYYACCMLVKLDEIKPVTILIMRKIKR